MEVRLLTRVSNDESSVLVKKQRIPKNWKDSSTIPTSRNSFNTSNSLNMNSRGNNNNNNNNSSNESYFTPMDLLCGKIIDVYGRKLFLLTCDDVTREYYQENDIEQQEIIVERSANNPSLRADSKTSSNNYSNNMNGNGNGNSNRDIDLGMSLPLGNESETRKQMIQKFNDKNELSGITLRCRCQLLNSNDEGDDNNNNDRKKTSQQRSNSSNPSTPNYRRGQRTNYINTAPDTQPYQYPRPPTGQWFQTNSTSNSSRILLLTFFLEDNSISLNEESTQNTLLTGAGTGRGFLRRGIYVNDMTGRNCEGNDIYEGNLLRINGHKMKIIEMDESSSLYCEDMSNEEDYIYYNIDLIGDKLLDKVRLFEEKYIFIYFIHYINFLYVDIIIKHEFTREY